MMFLFERSALIAVVGLVAGLVVAVLVSPLERATAAPKASLRMVVSQLIQASVVPKAVAPATATTAAKTVKTAPKKAKTAPKKATLAGIDTLTGVVSVRAVIRPRKRPPLKTAEALSETFQQLGYDLERVRTGESGVPRLFLASLPGDLKDIRESRVRKTLFFKTVLPLVLQVNEEILRDRRRLWKLHFRLGLNQKLKAADRLWLIMMAERYGVKRGDVASLLQRVDIIPPSLALAQAAEESGWGTSRFVREGNAVF
ncbi:MAG: glucosaminidase domain-containing protein, partial [Proteobacteria bacterium]|nr:glucosaminidase domain-containing protein [Pseudomonadota bacterium]